MRIYLICSSGKVCERKKTLVEKHFWVQSGMSEFHGLFSLREF